MITVCSLALVRETVARTRPVAVVSLLSPEDDFPTIDGLPADRHHRVHLHDISEVLPGRVPPEARHVEELIAFLSEWNPDDPLLIHCWAGISRSTATAFIAACLHNPDTPEAKIARALRAASPTAWPNRRIVAFADSLMGRDGSMAAAIADMPQAEVAMSATPFHLPSRFPADRAAGTASPQTEGDH